jgi:hypothetical protein
LAIEHQRLMRQRLGTLEEAAKALGAAKVRHCQALGDSLHRNEVRMTAALARLQAHV